MNEFITQASSRRNTWPTSIESPVLLCRRCGRGRVHRPPMLCFACFHAPAIVAPPRPRRATRPRNAPHVVEKLVASAFDIAIEKAERFARHYPELRDDFLSDSLLALFRAARIHDGGRGRFEDYARAAVRSACCGVLRSKLPLGLHRWRRPLSLDLANDGLCLLDTLPSRECEAEGT